MPLDATPVIELDDVSFTFNGEPAIEHVGFSITPGEYAGIIGPNGGGKTTLLRLILGLLKPSSGSVRLFGQETAGFKDWPRIGYLPQRAAHIDARFPITVEEVVSQGRVAKAGLLKRFSAADRSAIDEAIALNELEHLRRRLISDLSGGERQRVFIARALTSQPELLLLDEPAAGVDVGSQGRFYSFLRELNQQRGLTIVFVSHDVDIIAGEASQIICINRALVCAGDASVIFREKRQLLESLYGTNMHLMFHHE